MQVILDEQGYVVAYALVGKFGSPSITVDDPENIDDFENNYRSYCLSNGSAMVKNKDKQAEIENERELAKLRSQREKDCFQYVNRSHLWHNRLNNKQRTELENWYQAWLDVTETKVIPEKPNWLK